MGNEKQLKTARMFSKRSNAGEIWHRFRRNKGAMLGLIIIVIIVTSALSAPLWIDYETDVIEQHVSERLQGPSWRHLCGTDEYGRDIFYRIVWGARYSLAVGVVAVIISLAVGVTLGAIAGHFGGGVDLVIMRACDIFGAIPSILMGIVLVHALGATTFNLMLAVGLASVPQFTRITRAAVFTASSSDYVESARAVGIRETEIIAKHVLPNCLSPIIVQSTLRIASAIIAASSLSFLGLGVPAPAPEWGSLLSSGRRFVRGYGYMTLFPGLAIMITVLAFNMMGDGLRDALDPKLKN